jgi:hypothetical protein
VGQTLVFATQNSATQSALMEKVSPIITSKINFDGSTSGGFNLQGVQVRKSGFSSKEGVPCSLLHLKNWHVWEMH